MVQDAGSGIDHSDARCAERENNMELLAGALLGVLLGLGVFLLLRRQDDSDRDAVSALVSGVNGEERLRTLEQSIASSLRDVRDASDRANETVRNIDRAQGISLAELRTILQSQQQSVARLQETTGKLTDTLSNSQARGQWGERIAADILQAAGLVEGINFRRNQQIEGGSTRPDYTFTLPQGRLLNMDVKFPIASYVRVREASTDAERLVAERQFLADVRTAIGSVKNRNYVDPAGGTLGFVLVFIPNEQIFSFVNERDPHLLQETLDSGVVLCSPTMLFALLSVVRQASDMFSLARRTDEILGTLGMFTAQWNKYQEAVQLVGRRLLSAQKAFDDLSGARTRQLERQLEPLERLRQEHNIDLPELVDAEPVLAAGREGDADDDGYNAGSAPQ